MGAGDHGNAATTGPEARRPHPGTENSHESPATGGLSLVCRPGPAVGDLHAPPGVLRDPGRPRGCLVSSPDPADHTRDSAPGGGVRDSGEAGAGSGPEETPNRWLETPKEEKIRWRARSSSPYASVPEHTQWGTIKRGDIFLNEPFYELFRLRIKSRYLEPIDLLIENDSKRTPTDRKYGFTILAIDCLLIETLQAFREGSTDTKSKSKKMFINFLTQRKSFRKYFNSDEAEDFYDDFRCGILHQAEVMGDSLLWSVGMVKGKKFDGTPYINRTKIHEYIGEEVGLYCE